MTQHDNAKASDVSPGSQGPASEETISPDEARYWIEFGCWTALVLAPFLYWVNGPAVSHDQFVVRTALVVIAAVGAVGLRLYALWRKKQRR